MNLFKSASFTAGILFGLLVCIVIFKIANQDHRARTAYDERQKEIRGRGYRAGFYAFMLYELLFTIFGFCGISVPLEMYQIHLLALVFGGMVLTCYCIWHDAYWGLNNDRRRYYAVFAFLLVLNLLPVVLHAVKGELFEDGVLNSLFPNLLVSGMMIVLGGVLLARHFVGRRLEAEEEE